MPPTNPINYLFISSLTDNISWEIGSPFPPEFPVNIDSHRSSPYYPQYKVRFIKNVGNTTVDILTISDGSNIVDYITSSSGIFNRDVTIGFQNFDQLNQGTYPIEIFFDLYGVNSSGVEYAIDSSYIYFEITVTGQADIISTDQPEYNLIFNRQNNTLTGDLSVQVLNNVNDASLGFFNTLEIFKNVNPISNNTFQLEPKSALANNVNLPLEGEYDISAYIFKNVVGQPPKTLKTFDIQLFVLNSNLLVSPTNIIFSLQQINSETKSEILKIINPENKPFTISGPYWLTFSASSGSASANITVTTLNSAVLPVGETAGDIVIQCDGKTITVPVKMNVISFIYMTGLEAYNFCLDNKILNFSRRETTARFVRSTLAIKFRSEIETVNMSVPIVVPYFNDKGSFDLGKKMHQYFLRMRKPILQEAKKPNIFDNKVWLYPAEVAVKVEELDADYNVVHTDSVSMIKFYPGKKPAAFPLLSDNLVKQRVAGSKYIFSYIQGLLDTEKISMAAPNALEDGLIVRAKIEDDENKIFFTKKKVFDLGNNKKLEYYTIPNNGPHLFQVQYENQNLCPEAFFFTGHFKKNPEYTHIYSKSVLTALQEKYEVKKIEIWTVNTGFMLKKCSQIIDQLIRSRLCYLEINGVLQRGFFISQKFVAEDSSLELIQFDLEFLITE